MSVKRWFLLDNSVEVYIQIHWAGWKQHEVFSMAVNARKQKCLTVVLLLLAQLAFGCVARSILEEWDKILHFRSKKRCQVDCLDP